MNKTYIIILTVIIAIVAVGAAFVKHNSREYYYYLADHKSYFWANTLIELGFYKADFRDVDEFYGKVDFKYIKRMISRSKIKLGFIPIHSETTTEEIEFFLKKGADINDYSYFIWWRGFACILRYMDAEYPILYSAIYYERYDLIPFLLEKGADPLAIVDIKWYDESYDNIQSKIDSLLLTPRQLLENKEKKDKTPGKFAYEIEILKRYEDKYKKVP